MAFWLNPRRFVLRTRGAKDERGGVRNRTSHKRGRRQQSISDLEELAGQDRDRTVVWPHLKTTVVSAIQHIPLYKSKSFLNQKYSLEGLSIAQIAALCFASKEAVRSSLIRFNIPLREPHKPHGRPAQPRYGEKVVKGQAVTHQAEQRAVDAILEMAGQGLSLRQIAKVLNQMKVPTKCRGKSWHPEMVKRIIRRYGQSA